MWKDFFYYRRGERIAILILLALIGAAIGGGRYYASRQEKQYALLVRDSAFIAACDSFYLTLRKEEPAYRNYEKPPLRPVAFDPNDADSARFVSMGLAPWIARNILRYREKGGRFFRPDQFARIYGVDSLTYQALLPFIRIDTLKLKKNYLRYEKDTLRPDYPRKFEELTLVELNTADTLLLKKIPGIGSGFAAMLIRYRAQLGGFRSVSQLREIAGVTDSIYRQWEPWFFADPALITPLPVNKSGITRLRNHPYLNFYQARAMMELKKEYKRIKSLEELALLEEFSPADLERLEPYLQFED